SREDRTSRAACRRRVATRTSWIASGSPRRIARWRALRTSRPRALRISEAVVLFMSASYRSSSVYARARRREAIDLTHSSQGCHIAGTPTSAYTLRTTQRRLVEGVSGGG